MNVADFNGDGFLDIATTNSSNFAVWFKWGRGDGTYADDSWADFLPDLWIHLDSSAVGDFNKDGLADLAVADSFINSASILLQNKPPVVLPSIPQKNSDPEQVPDLTPDPLPRLDDPTCNGTHCDSKARIIVNNYKKMRSIFRSYSKSSFVLTGKLVDRIGQPIQGAKLDLSQQISIRGSAQQRLDQPTTGKNGEWKVTVPPGPSRSVRVAYKTSLSDVNYAAMVNIDQRTAGLLTFSISKVVRTGQPAYVKGQVFGGKENMPQNGKIVELQVFFKGRFRTFKSIRTASDGTYKHNLRFGTSYRRGTYRFRARVRKEQGWPFSSTVSKSRKIRIM